MGTNGPIVPSIERDESGDGIVVVDPIEHRRYALTVSALDGFDAARADAFPVPVDTTAAFHADRIRLEEVVEVVIHDDEGKMVTEVAPLTEAALPAGAYHIELYGPVKICMGVETSLTFSASADEITIDFPGARRVRIGARSYHRRPAGTITTPDEPAALAAALSVLGSALKTTSPERAYPTLRGHPPAIELGDELEIPSTLAPPETGVTIAVPPDYAALFAVAPLAYYLGAEVTIADRPRLLTDSGLEYPLGDGPGGVERAAERVLKQVFLLDCVTRTEGFYRIDLHERAAVEPHVDLDFGWLYGQPLATQLEAYLAVPFETIEPHVPTWNLVAHVPPAADRVAVLPSVVDRLAIVRTPKERTLSSSNVRSWVLSAYADGRTETDSSIRAGRSANGSAADGRIVQLDATDAMDDAWFGGGAPLNGTKALAQAYRNRFERVDAGWPLNIAVIRNDRDMASKFATAGGYDSGEEPFDVTRYHDLTTAELRSVLAAGVDFLHYIGHTDADGFRCRDGPLDVATLDAVDVGMFFLNSCRSYRQGVRLIEAGSVGGVVTLSDVNDEGAATVGATMARLLQGGFPLRAALQLAARTSVVGGHYIVVGDGTADLVSTETGIPVACHVDAVDGGRYDVTVAVFLPREGGMGTTVYPLLETNDRHYLAPGRVRTFRATAATLDEYLTGHPVPVVFDGDLILDDHHDRLGL